MCHCQYHCESGDGALSFARTLLRPQRSSQHRTFAAIINLILACIPRRIAVARNASGMCGTNVNTQHAGATQQPGSTAPSSTLPNTSLLTATSLANIERLLVAQTRPSAVTADKIAGSIADFSVVASTFFAGIILNAMLTTAVSLLPSTDLPTSLYYSYYPQFPTDVSDRLLTVFLLLLTSFAVALNLKVVVLLYPGHGNYHWKCYIVLYWLLLFAYACLILASVGLTLIVVLCKLPSFESRLPLDSTGSVQSCTTRVSVAFGVLGTLMLVQTIAAFVILCTRGYP